MPELIEAGYVYIAKLPLYKLKQGSSERYVEKDSELKQILLSDKFEKTMVFDRDGVAVQAHRAALAALLAPAQAVRGLVVDAARGVRQRHRRLPRGVGRARRAGRAVEAAVELIERDGIENAPYETRSSAGRRGHASPFARSRRSPAWRARCAIPRRLFGAQDYRNFSRVHSQLVELAGRAPFEVRLGDRKEQAMSFEALREAVLAVAQKGISLQRFKGLGEMNAAQLRDTTMDPATRTLAQGGSRTPRRPT